MFMARIATLAAGWLLLPILAGAGSDPDARPGEAGAPVPAAAVAKPEADSPATPTVDLEYEAIKEQSLREWASIKALTATLTTIAEFGPTGNRVLRRSVGQYDYRTRDGKTFIRWDTVDMTVIRKEQGDTMTRHRKLIVHDGASIYVQRERSARAKVEKVAAGSVGLMPLGGPGFFETLERYHHVKGLEPESLNGRPVHVIGARPKWGYGMILYYFDRETGLLLKKHTGDASPGDYETTLVTGIDTAKVFGKDHFLFVPPEGVDVHDTTAGAARDAPILEQPMDALPERKDGTSNE